MAGKAPLRAGSGVMPKPPAFLTSKRARDVWKYTINALDSAGLDWTSALLQIALLADKVDDWRTHVEEVDRYGHRYDEDANGGSLETDESRAERRARGEVMKDLDEGGLTVMAAGQVRALDRMLTADLFASDPFAVMDQLGEGGANLPKKPPWSMTKAEARAWREIQPLLQASGFDYSSAGIALGLICAAIADWQACKQWILDNRGKIFAAAKETGRRYEVSASYNRAKIAKQIRELLKRNGMTVASCAKTKALSKGRVISEDLAELLGYINDRPD